MGGEIMTRRSRTGSVMFAVAALTALCLLLEAPPPAFCQQMSPDAKAQLQKRDSLRKETVRLRREGKLAEAIAAAEAMLAIERKALRADHPDLAISLGWLADLNLERDDFAAARAARQEALEILRKRFGEAHWKVTDARLALEDVDVCASLTVEQRRRLTEAARLNRKVLALYKEGKYAEAVTAARNALVIRKEVRGDRHPDYADSLNNLAASLESQGGYAAARPLYERALAIRKEVVGERHPAYANSLNNLAGLLRGQGDYAAARTLYEQALAINKELLGERHPVYATSLDNLAGLLKSQGDYAAARPLYERALAIRKEVLGERHPDYATSLNNLAGSLKSQGEYAAARPLYERALAVNKELLGERHPRYATGLDSLANLFYSQGDYAAARPLYEKALAIKRGALGERHPDYANSLNNLADLLGAQGDYAAARRLYERALAVKKEVLGERHPDYAHSLNSLAFLRESQGDYAAARPLYERALAIRKEVLGERHPDYAGSLNNLAHLLQSQGDYAAARPLFERALAIHKEVLGERHDEYAKSLNNLAVLLQSQGDYAAARPLLQRALAITKEVLGERHPEYATSLNNLAGLLELQKNYVAARPLYERALAIRKEVLGERHPDYANSLNCLAELLRSQGDYATARPLYERALAIRKEVPGENHPNYPTSLNNLALLLNSQGDYAAARPLYERALAITKEILGERHPAYAISLSNLGFFLWKSSELAAAAPLLKQALEITEGNVELAAAVQSERQQLAMTRALRVDLDAYLSLPSPARISPRDAYQHLLRAKGAVFERQRLIRTQRRRHPGDSEAARRLQEYTQTVAQLSVLALGAPDPKKPEEWKARIEELSQRKDKLEAELSRLDAGFREVQAVASRTPEQLQSAIPSDTALVDFLLYWAFQPPAQEKGKFQGEWRVLAFVVRPGQTIARVELGPAEPIDAAINAWRPLLVSGKADQAEIAAAATLRRLIWEPLEAQLAGVSSVLISPDAAIGFVPLGALPGKEPGHYLIEERAIALVPVPRMMAPAPAAAVPAQGGARSAADTAPALLLAGDIDYGGDPGSGSALAMRRSAASLTRAGLLGQFKPLSYTRGEILEIRDSFAKRFSNARAEALRGNEATEEAIRQKAPQSRYLHLATHGYFAPPELRSALAPTDPKASRSTIDALGGAGVAGYHPGLLSGIALAGANIRPTPTGQDDGILTALEVAELDLSGVELAVLSACETGLGEVAGGEGLLGLQRAFQVAGAHSVVASLWPIGDEPTRALMARFYDNLWRKGQPPAQALREAQLSMLRGELAPAESKPDPSRGLRRPTAPQDYRRPYFWAAFVLSTDRIPAPPEQPTTVSPAK
jgi:CHAT domain-containing protein/tetratricopeptide (TPR) repeat protein